MSRDWIALALGRLGALEGGDEGQRALAFLEVRAHRLAEARLVGDEVERVVADLERDADVESVAREPLHLLRAGLARAAPPIRQQADMNDAVFWVMIRR